jgi:hypothetical protein
MIITQILDQEISRWHGLARAFHYLIPTLTHLTFQGGTTPVSRALSLFAAGAP